MGFDSGKESIFNEASLKVERIHKSQNLINNVRTNLLQFHPDVNKYGYEITITELLSLMFELRGKLSDKNKELCSKWRQLIVDMVEVYKPYEKKIFNTITGEKIQSHLNIDKWKKLREAIFSLEDFIRDLLEEAGYAAPNKAEEEGFD